MEYGKIATTSSRFHTRRRDEKEFRMLINISIVFFLLVMILQRLLPWNWSPWLRDGTRRQSVFAEARKAAYTTIPFAFMG